MANNYKRKIPISVDCGIHLFMEVMNGKWKISLIWTVYNGIKRPAEIHRKISGASRRVLDTQLNQLVDHGLISKKVYDQRPLKVEYELTELGKTLIPVIASTARWGEEHRDILERTIFLSGN
ncbi:helix-turn-helix domain-containing protein [Pedobacter miscanthi]|uniref:winged helix-turn-helix transcriptional regulator n=1 Tax=Pedobacter miscanthi TaxID=2259170 RepID=UPI00292F61D5|nr:helix-turn-helix domain-containing protein [Pedobacter miscanthi]